MKATKSKLQSIVETIAKTRDSIEYEEVISNRFDSDDDVMDSDETKAMIGAFEIDAGGYFVPGERKNQRKTIVDETINLTKKKNKS